MCAARVRRLPGFRFETQAPPLPEVLPRMDIAVFVGFAAAGPLQIPVAIESEAQFQAIFGDDAPLAWDLERGEQLYAYLGPAVRAFFGNKGQRCWVIRVAKQSPNDAKDLNFARYNYFPISALARAEFDEDGNLLRVMPAFARARSEGSWSDSVQAGAAVLARPAQIAGPIGRDGSTYRLWIKRSPGDEFSKGELLQLDFGDDRIAFLAVSDSNSAETSPPVSPPSSAQLVELKSTKAIWLKRVTVADAPPWLTKFAVRTFTKQANTSNSFPDLSINWFGKAYLGEFEQESPSGAVTVKVNCAPTDAPSAGAIVRLSLPTVTMDRWWMTVENVSLAGDGNQVVLTGRAFQQIAPPASLPASTPTGQRLNFEIAVRKNDEFAVSLSDLGFEAAHERFWGNLPTDEDIYRETDSSDTTSPSTILWSQVGDLFRFPLAGVPPEDNTTEMYFPLSMPLLAENYLGPTRLNGSTLERDGLAEFDEELFLDPELIETQTSDLAGQAEYLMYLSPQPRLLAGMHAAFPVEEATLIAVPDAIHRAWTSVTVDPLPQPAPSLPLQRPEWWPFLDCNAPALPAKPALDDCEPASPPASAIKQVHEPAWGNFLDCSIEVIEAPLLSASTNISEDGTFTLSWIISPPIDGAFVLEESGASDFINAETIYSGRATSFTLYGRKAGDYFYRVRVCAGGQSSDWSNGVAVRVGEAVRWVIEDQGEASPPEDFTSEVLLAVQRSLLRMCAARGDLVCLLSLPVNYREDAAIAHVELLKSSVLSSTSRVSPLTSGEMNDLTYGAIFHPWLIEREQDEADRLTHMPPCGAVAGLFADRALSRGAWIAPANQPMRAVVALEPPINPARRFDLQEARINLVRQEPRGFLVLDAETLSDDPDLVQMNVRRLLILLRRQALRLGATYVFEPNSPAFRRAVDRGFTQMLDSMFERGAFAGATPATAYQVVTDDSLNTPQSVDQGQFIVELKVAPSLPMTFLTIRLIQTSDRSLAQEVG
ncbi:MAG TPA: hypothetical protein VNG71_17725 [Pyrinomonadaceae bacterium]|nr:hypothetical protein [Pyrinomonadaceae bacterium]